MVSESNRANVLKGFNTWRKKTPERSRLTWTPSELMHTIALYSLPGWMQTNHALVAFFYAKKYSTSLLQPHNFEIDLKAKRRMMTLKVMNLVCTDPRGTHCNKVTKLNVPNVGIITLFLMYTDEMNGAKSYYPFYLGWKEECYFLI